MGEDFLLDAERTAFVFKRGRILAGVVQGNAEGQITFRQSGLEIVRVSTSGGPLQQVVAPLSPNASISGMDIDERTIWWTVPANLDGPGCLWQANRDGSQPSPIECGLRNYHDVRVDGAAVYLVRDLQIVRFPKKQ